MMKKPQANGLRWTLPLLLFLVLLQGCLGRSANLDDPPFSRDEALLEKAWALPVAKIWKEYPLDYQIYEGYCGAATAVNIAHSLNILYANQDTVLDGFTLGEWDVRTSGMTLDELSYLIGIQTGKRTAVIRFKSLAAFKAELKKTNDPAYRYAINFHRKPLFGGGWGHHSPVAGYLEAENMALVLDVSHNYGPYLVDVDRLYESISLIDSSTDKKRGLVRIQ